MERQPDDGEQPSASSANERYAYLAGDILSSRREHRLAPADSEELPSKVAEQLLREVDEFLAEHEVRSKEELRFLMQKVDSAIAINNDPKAKQIREDLVRKFGDDAKN